MQLGVYCDYCKQDPGCGYWYGSGFAPLTGQAVGVPWGFPFQCGGMFMAPFNSQTTTAAFLGTTDPVAKMAIAKTWCCGVSSTTCKQEPGCHWYVKEMGGQCDSGSGVSMTTFTCAGGLYDSPVSNPYIGMQMGMTCGRDPTSASCKNLLMGELGQYCCGKMMEGGDKCSQEDYFGCQKTFFKLGGMCKSPCTGAKYDTPCPFEDAALCMNLKAMSCNATNTPDGCLMAMGQYCCGSGTCTSDYGCKKEFFEKSTRGMALCQPPGGAPFQCPEVSIYKCPFNDPFVCGQCAGSATVITDSGLPVFNATCTAALQNHCCGDTNMTCPQSDHACQSYFFATGYTCKPLKDYNNCHNGFYDLGQCNGFRPTAPFCENQFCKDNAYQIPCAVGQILPYCCGEDADTCSLDPQCQNLVFRMFNSPFATTLKTTMVTYGPKAFQNLADKPCPWQCSWTNMTRSPTKAPSTKAPTGKPTSKSPTAAPKKSSATGLSALVALVAMLVTLF
jgi:hypothetical protein